MRSVYADMLTLFEPLMEVEGRHAASGDLRLVHTPDYLEAVQEWVRRADRAGGPIEVQPGLMVSPATWDASLAAVGCVLEGIDSVMKGYVRNAFCAVRPPARDAGADQPGRYGFLNHIAVAARYLIERAGLERVLVIEWGGIAAAGIGALPPDDRRIRVVRVADRARDQRDPRIDQGGSGTKARAADGSPLDSVSESVAATLGDFEPDFMLLSAGFDELAGDPLSPGSLVPHDYFAPTSALRDMAERRCDGRLVSVLEGGYGSSVGAAIVEHLRALAGLDPGAGAT
jgi:acetoin utilization deacetylase AcuC-like enzyme